VDFMMNDDNRFDKLLRNAAEDYNRPPVEVPRDAMWARIETTRAERARRPLQIVLRTPHRPISRYTWLGAAAAAVLLVATGVGIGRWSTARVAVPASVEKARAVASNGGGTGLAIPSGEQPSGTNDSHISGSAVTGSANPSDGQRPTGEGHRATGSGQRAAGNGHRATATGQRPPGNGQQATGNGTMRGTPRQEVPYQVATIRHLANAEALLTAFRTDSHDAKMDAQLSTWARDLLSNTRLLLDSPAGDDPQRAKLLGDLELVLAQIVQLSPGAAMRDRELIEGSIRNGQVMTRLRSAIPAGPTRGL
jgi:hypothetical protein